MRIRDRIADRLCGGQITSLADGLQKSMRAAEHARAANRASQGALSRVLRQDVARSRYMRACRLAGAVLARFDSGDVATARVGQDVLTEWWAVYDELSRPLPEEDQQVTDREPQQPAIVQPLTDSQPHDFGSHPIWAPFRELHARLADDTCACTEDGDACRNHELMEQLEEAVRAEAAA